MSATTQMNYNYEMTLLGTYLFGIGDELLQLIMQRFQQTFTLFILTSKTGQHD